MKTILLILTVVVSALPDTALAADGCLGLLGTALSSSQQQLATASQSSISKDAGTYLRLIEYALEKITENSEKQNLIKSLQVATLVPTPINVFANQTSTLGAQLSQNVDRLRIVQNMTSDWPMIQAQLRVILGKYLEKDTDREQAEHDTEWVKVIDQSWKILLNSSVESNPSWQQIGGDWYLAVGSLDFKIYVVKLTVKATSAKQVLTIVAEYATLSEVRSSPSWQQIGNDWYLAVGSDDSKVHVLKFNRNSDDSKGWLTLAGEHHVGDWIRSSLSWQQIGGDWYLAVGSDAKKVHVFKFNQAAKNLKTSLTVAGEFSTFNWVRTNPSWQQIGSEWYLAVGSNDEQVYVLHFDKDIKDVSQSLTVAGVYRTYGAVRSSPSWQLIGKEWYLAVGSADFHVYVLKFNKSAGDPVESLTVVGQYMTDNRVSSSPSWQQIGGNWYLAVGSDDWHVYVLKFNSSSKKINDALTVAGGFATEFLVESSPSWKQIADEWYLAVGSHDNSIYVLRFDSHVEDKEKALVVELQYMTGEWVFSSPSWQQVGNELYLAVGSNDRHLHLIKFRKKINKRN